jgi:hypothetical protein
MVCQLLMYGTTGVFLGVGGALPIGEDKELRAKFSEFGGWDAM